MYVKPVGACALTTLSSVKTSYKESNGIMIKKLKMVWMEVVVEKYQELSRHFHARSWKITNNYKPG
jgi:hypothetical protein